MNSQFGRQVVSLDRLQWFIVGWLIGSRFGFYGRLYDPDEGQKKGRRRRARFSKNCITQIMLDIPFFNRWSFLLKPVYIEDCLQTYSSTFAQCVSRPMIYSVAPWSGKSLQLQSRATEGDVCSKTPAQRAARF